MCMMAASVEEKGYDHQFVEPPPDDLLCLICLCVARDPQQINCCGKVLCKGCLREHKEHSDDCPQCRVPINSFADKRSDRDILSLKALCDNASNGCEWVGELRSLDEHLASCDFALLPCPNECQDRSRVIQLLRKDLENHTKEECPRRQYECPHCQKTGEYREMITNHLQICPMLEVPCPKRRCTTSILRCDLPKHREECLFEKVPCKYSTIGCDKEVERKDLKEHEGDTAQHLQLALNIVHQQQATIRDIQQTAEQQQITIEQQQVTIREIQQTASQQQNSIRDIRQTTRQQQITVRDIQRTTRQQESSIRDIQQTTKQQQNTTMDMQAQSWKMPMTFKITNFNQHKTANDRVYSPAFYTSPEGYKMCISVYANGDGEGRGTHVSVFAYLMKGENDDFLQWPFIGRVTFKLLNQLEDKNHHSLTATLSSDKECCRVVNQERASRGWGWSKYISHSDLGHNTAENSQYLKDDRLVFKISVIAQRSPTPWLI